MEKLRLPLGAEYVIDTLNKNGFSAHIVGGCVRDFLLGRKSDDYDINTSALPAEVKSLFDKTIDTGIDHGTVTVMINGESYEVTTYRIDGEYQDMRHPESVSFTSELREDLSRRDFTINAMAYNHNDGVVDLFCGMEDIKKRTVRAVGDPYLRFTEDALRVLRGIRFASVLGFNVEKNTAEAIHALAHNLVGVSRERIYVEWKKLLSGVSAYEIIDEFFDVIKVFIPTLDRADLPSRDVFMSLSATHREIALLRNLGAEGFRECMRSLKTSTAVREYGAAVLSIPQLSMHPTDTELKLYLISDNDEASLGAAYIMQAFGETAADTPKRLESLIANGHPRRPSMLAVGGKDLITLGYRGERIGKILSDLLISIAEGKVENNKEALTEYVESFL